MKPIHYFIIAILLFVGYGFMDRALDLLDPCFKNHSAICQDQPDYKPE